jgi:hypothetical protein
VLTGSTDLLLPVTGAPLASRRMRISVKNQHATWQLTFGMMGNFAALYLLVFG